MISDGICLGKQNLVETEAVSATDRVEKHGFLQQPASLNASAVRTAPWFRWASTSSEVTDETLQGALWGFSCKLVGGNQQPRGFTVRRVTPGSSFYCLKFSLNFKVKGTWRKISRLISSWDTNLKLPNAKFALNNPEKHRRRFQKGCSRYLEHLCYYPPIENVKETKFCCEKLLILTAFLCFLWYFHH